MTKKHKNAPVHHVVDDSRLKNRTEAGWELVDTYVLQDVATRSAFVCQTCGHHSEHGHATCRVPNCNGYMSHKELPAGQHSYLRHLIRLDPETHAHQQHLEIERLQASLEEARDELNEADEKVKAAEARAQRAENDAEYDRGRVKGLQDANTKLRDKNDIMEIDLTRLIDALGRKQIEEILGGGA